jgi:predicted amino acid racemase
MTARIEVNCEYIRRNAEELVALCGAYGVDVVGVTKACCRPGART